jgi:LL-H family phage holin
MTFIDSLALLAQTLLIIALPILVMAVAYWLKQRADEIKSKLGKDKLTALESIAAVAVRAAEQAGLSKQLKGGAAKREQALRVAQDYLNSLGLKLDVQTITSAIESEVLRQFNSGQPPTDSSEARAALLDKAVEVAVLAAEQSGLKAAAAGATANGEQKKQYALSLAQKYLETNGIKVDLSVVDGLLEAQIMKFKMQAAGNVGASSGGQGKRMGGR